jgi:hypothetical protein
MLLGSGTRDCFMVLSAENEVSGVWLLCEDIHQWDSFDFFLIVSAGINASVNNTTGRLNYEKIIGLIEAYYKWKIEHYPSNMEVPPYMECRQIVACFLLSLLFI